MTPTDRPFSPSCERNRAMILGVLDPLLEAQGSVFEIASGTGQHAAYCLARRPGWRWQCSDLPERLPGIGAWLADVGDSDRAPDPIALNVETGPWPSKQFDVVFTANSLHIVSWPAACAMLAAVPALLKPGGYFAAYGPFLIDGQFTSPSNAAFDADLRRSAAHMGIRDLQHVSEQLPSLNGPIRHDLPANNHCVVWQKPR